MKHLMVVLLLALTGCASTHDFVEGSKYLGAAIWGAAGNTHTECTYVDGHGNVCYQAQNRPYGALSPEQEAEMEAQVREQVAKENAAQALQKSTYSL